MELVTALENSYRGIMAGKDLTGARIGETEKAWARDIVAENLFTNPNLLGDGIWREVRRNWMQDSSFDNPDFTWSVTPAASIVSKGGGVITIEIVADTNPINFLMPMLSWTPGISGVASTRYVVENLSSVQIPFAVESWNGTVYTTGPTVSIPPGATRTVSSINATIPAGSPYFQPRLRVQHSTLPIGSVIRVSEPQQEQSATLGPYFDGNTTSETAEGVSQPESYRWRWLGEPHASQSVMESNGTWAEVARNLFTNPNLEGGGTFSEVRRNHSPYPSMKNSTSGWAVTPAAAAFTPTSDGLLVDVTAPAGGAAILFNSNSRPASAGQQWSAGMDIEVPEGFPPLSIRFVVYSYGQNLILNTAYHTIGTGERKRVEVGGGTPVTEDTTGVRIILYGNGDNEGRRFIASNAMLEPTATPGPYFDGSTTPETASDIVQPEDFRWRWLGAENASDSVMEIERVRGFTGSHGIPGVSTREGKPAVRIIPTGASSSGAYIEIPGPARSLGTAIGTVHLETPLTGDLTPNHLCLISQSPQTASVSAPNEVGSHEIRHEFGLSSQYYLTLRNGASQGNGDVWWTDIGLFEGDYHGEWKGNSDLSNVTQSEDFRVRWLGTPNASERVIEIEQVRGLIGTNAIAGVSTFEGKPAVRVILTSNGGFAYFLAPTILRPNPSTVLGTVRLREPHGSLYTTYARTLLARSPDTATPQAPGEPGSYPLKLSLPPMPSLFQVRLNNGGLYGASTDVWWTDIGIFAGDYTGEAFSGDTPDYGRDTYTWTGEENNSTSIKTSWL